MPKKRSVGKKLSLRQYQKLTDRAKEDVHERLSEKDKTNLAELETLAKLKEKVEDPKEAALADVRRKNIETILKRRKKRSVGRK